MHLSETALLLSIPGRKAPFIGACVETVPVECNCRVVEVLAPIDSGLLPSSATPSHANEAKLLLAVIPLVSLGFR